MTPVALWKKIINAILVVKENEGCPASAGRKFRVRVIL